MAGLAPASRTFASEEVGRRDGQDRGDIASWGIAWEELPTNTACSLTASKEYLKSTSRLATFLLVTPRAAATATATARTTRHDRSSGGEIINCENELGGQNGGE